MYTGNVDDVSGNELAGLQSLNSSVILTNHLGNLWLILLERLDRTFRVPFLYTSDNSSRMLHTVEFVNFLVNNRPTNKHYGLAKTLQVEWY